MIAELKHRGEGTSQLTGPKDLALSMFVKTALFDVVAPLQMDRANPTRPSAPDRPTDPALPAFPGTFKYVALREFERIRANNAAAWSRPGSLEDTRHTDHRKL